MAETYWQKFMKHYRAKGLFYGIYRAKNIFNGVVGVEGRG